MSIKIKQLKNKEKIGTVLDRDIILKIKERALKEGRTISEIIEDAVLNYDVVKKPGSFLRKEAVSSFCSKPFELSLADTNELLNEDFYG